MTDFKDMSIKELKAFVKANKTNTEAFHALMDKLNARSNQKLYVYEDINKLGELIEQYRESTQG